MRYILSSMFLISAVASMPAACKEAQVVELVSCHENCKKEAEAKALAGDIEAARDMVHATLYSGHEEVNYWTRIGAENGDVIAQRNFGLHLLQESGSARDHARGAYWLEKAANAGSKEAKEELERYRRGGVEAINPDPGKKSP